MLNCKLLLSDPLAFFLSIKEQPFHRSLAFYFRLAYLAFALTLADHNWIWEQLLGGKIFPWPTDWLLLPCLTLAAGIIAATIAHLILSIRTKISSLSLSLKAGIYSLIPFVFLWAIARTFSIALFFFGAGRVLIPFELAIDLAGFGWAVWTLSAGLLVYHQIERKYTLSAAGISFIAALSVTFIPFFL